VLLHGSPPESQEDVPYFTFVAVTSQNACQVEPSLECSHVLLMVLRTSLNTVVHRTCIALPCIYQSPVRVQVPSPSLPLNCHSLVKPLL